MHTRHKPTLRTLSILEFLSSNNHRHTLTEISRHLDVSTSTLFPILHTLREQRYLDFDAKSHTYSLGIRLFEIGSRVQETHGYQQITEIMNDIQSVCGETCHFGILDGGDVLYLIKAEAAEQPIRMRSMVGKRLPAYGTAIGKALLKNYSLEALKRLYPGGLKPLTAHTITDFDKLHEQLNSNDIFLYDKEESTDAIACVAIPIYRKGVVAASCSVAFPLFRYNDEAIVCAERALKKALVRFEQVIHDVVL